MEEKREGRAKYVLKVLSSLLNDACTQYAQSKITDDDLISVHDGIKTLDIVLVRGEGKDKQFCTIKKSSVLKFENYYEEKLIEIINKIVK